MLRCFILDDEQHAVDALAAMLKKKFSGEVEVAGTSIDPHQAIEQIESLQPDVVFLDVEMPILNGLEVLRYFPQRDFHIIFTTAHEKYALPALKAAATDYLVKPISPQDVHHALQKCKTPLPSSRKAPEPATPRLVLPAAQELIVVNIPDIVRIEGQNNYSHFHFLDRAKVIVAKTLKEYEDQLTPHGFFRVHQSHLINLAHIESIQSSDGDYVLLKKGHRVELSRRRKAEFIQLLKLKG
jgi:two-component system, LytTR family, response regulator